jgi:putative holliday junction resolvase
VSLPRPLPSTGRLLGIDPGTVRLGLSVSDPDRIIASPLDTYTRKDPAADAAHFQQLIRGEQLVGIIMGLPISLSGEEGPKAKETRAFAEWLAHVTQVPIEFVDERFTTSAADDVLQARGVKREKRKGQRDRIAAVLILQAFLDTNQR